MVDAICAEDTRHTRQLLTACGIDRPLLALHEHNEAEVAWQLVERLRADVAKELGVQPATGILLKGPPGTGKSQTITNLLAHAIAEAARKFSSHPSDSRSRWLVGSSSSSRSGWDSSRRHRATLLRSPPERLVTSASGGGQRSASMA